jgi:hypothetical protein
MTIQLIKLMLFLSWLFVPIFSDLCASDGPENSESLDPRAQQVADKLMQALGGKENWDKARYLRFDFVVEQKGKVVGDFKHLWDRYTGRYRVEGTTDKNERYVVLFQDINAKRGDVFLNGLPVADKAKQKFLDMGYERFINDSYWLLMPYKWKDPGVHLKYEGTAKGDKGQVWDKVLLTFGNVGLTPKDRYWAFINQKTGMMDKWEFILQGQKGPPSAFDWMNWQDFAGIKLCTEMKSQKEPLRILFTNVAVLQSSDDKPFTSVDAHL